MYKKTEIFFYFVVKMLESIYYRLKIMLEYHFQHDCFINDKKYFQTILYDKMCIIFL